MIMKICRREVSRRCIATFELADFLSNISRIIETEEPFSQAKMVSYEMLLPYYYHGTTVSYYLKILLRIVLQHITLNTM